MLRIIVIGPIFLTMMSCASNPANSVSSVEPRDQNYLGATYTKSELLSVFHTQLKEAHRNERALKAQIDRLESVPEPASARSADREVSAEVDNTARVEAVTSELALARENFQRLRDAIERYIDGSPCTSLVETQGGSYAIVEDGACQVRQGGVS